MRILIHPAVDETRLVKICAAAGDAEVVNASTFAEALAAMPEAEGFVGKITPELLAAAQRLRWVQSPTASLEHYLFPELVEHPCILTNMRGLFNDVIADHVMAYILCFARNFLQYLQQQHSGIWAPVGGESERTNNATGPGVVSAIDRAHLHLGDATLGIVGFGNIGREVARRGAAFDMKVLAVDALPQPPTREVEAVWSVERLPDLLAMSDFVVIAAPHTPATEGLFGRAQFGQMKRTGYLINIGRGVIVKLNELVEALQAGTIAGAGLDVFEIEPLPANHPLWQLPNVILTPHIAAASPRIAERHLDVILDNVRRFTRGEPLRNVADKRRWF